jgi:hypothetical protein
MVECDEIRCDSECTLMKPAPASIAYANLKERRAATRVTVGPGGTLADYAPFYYAPRSPMLYVNYRGGVDGNATGQNEIVHLVVDVDELIDAGGFVITDGHAATPLSTQFDDADGLEEIDWPIMSEKYWSDTDEDGDRKRRRQAEFLVHGSVSFSAVRLIGVIDAEIESRVAKLLEASPNHPRSISVEIGITDR